MIQPPIDLSRARELLAQAPRIAVLTGAGISKPSGIPTFRDAPGPQANVKPITAMNMTLFRADPPAAWATHWPRVLAMRAAQPNGAHHLLSRLEAQIDARAVAHPETRDAYEFTLVTQNIDGLHQRAGTRQVIELHGTAHKAQCTNKTCKVSFELDVSLAPAVPLCPLCGTAGRPGVVWFGEQLHPVRARLAKSAFLYAHVALIIGTSAQVYPAAGYAQEARAWGTTLIEINPEETDLTRLCHLSLRVSAEEGLRALMDVTR
ncbi:Sir2 family NAD-dependent protein deacetylase [Deinococcus soli (ex Cha et al. 2016)]|uniref:NAD-dependent deacetylase n=2 Tax=Deinococcus soli (ex Cha et al. 2016) TaxID=1309411 RepID=A0ACC6KGY2_9DEIO|nr:Sir2 family NAD-dependent protein deacetylase [Deinococcus soli (ex Cha et al. 2016)]MDR6219009.1 NAD-dependent deacetylase [Deinococcus soli (ex Cha et al. 2016)]MDR6328806.1 NAD-dependent deacetylase [Deinococcus soli (ex Cha et al. 2016)]MDR6751707.1 NAD-dependent deacetylase [Deinococcus soli (ex Cha et al. 2016)]